MSDNNQRADLEKQITEIKDEIARLTALLALRKIEEQHPLLEKLISGAHIKGSAVRQDYERLSGMAREKLEDISPAKSLAVLGGVLAIGSIGYAILSMLGIFDSKRK